MSSIVFIDSRVADIERLLAGLTPDARVVILDAAQDGISQIEEALAGVTGLDSLHIVSHGSSGALYLGSTVLTADNLPGYRSALSQIGESLCADGDIMLYGCDVGAGEAGQAFIAQLAELIGADVAASTDRTGSAAAGGDWVLEAATGGIETTVVAAREWAGTLAVITGTAGNDNLVGTAVADTISGLAGNDTLDGAAGADTLAGGAGQDVFLVNAGDTVIENVVSGIDQVQTGLSHTLAPNVENLTLTGTGDINGTGNAGSNVLTGNDGANLLAGAAGADVLLGGLGNDTLTGESSTPVFAISRASTRSSGVQATGFDSTSPDISADGRYVVFESPASLVAGDTNGLSDIFVKDLQTGTTSRVSTDSSGAQVMDGSSTSYISANGRYVVFQSTATNLVAGDTNGLSDIFVKDLQTGTTTRVSTDSTGAQAHSFSVNPVVSADGRYVAFETFSDNLVAGDTGANDIFVKDLLTGTTTRVSTDSAGAQADGDSFAAALSADGRYVLFVSSATNLVAGDTNGLADAFVKDLLTGTTTRVSTDSAGVQMTGGEFTGSNAISADGRYVALSSDASNLVAGDTNGTSDIFIKDLQTDVTTRVSTDSAGAQALTGSFSATISADGRYVAFHSVATNLVAGDTNLLNDVFLKDLQTGITTRISTDATGTQTTGGSSTLAALSADGRFVVFTSAATNLVAGDTNAVRDIFVATVLPVDVLQGGAGDDTYVIGSALDVVTDSAGTDTVRAGFNYTLGADFERLTLTGAGSINGAGNSGNNIVTGNSGANTLDGGGGDDTLAGAAGNDVFIVDSALDVIQETAGGGVADEARAGVSYTLAAGVNIENLTLTGSSVINGSGNELANVITGNSAANTLGGGAGNDTFDGGMGNDTYIVDSALDVIQETVGATYGTADKVLASVSYTLAGAVGIEYLTLTGASAINGTGNEQANVVTGNSAANLLDGGGSNDTLSGGGGNDTLNGGTGSDSLAAGAGDDTYVVDSEADVVTELAGKGTDTLRSQLASTTLMANVERLVLLGTTALEGFGNGLDNHLTGNVLANLLDGGVGADTMEGGKGDDIYIVANAGDVVVELNSSGNDGIETTVTYSLPNFVENLTLVGTAAINGTGNFLSNILVGNDGDNTLNGGLNDDIMIGGLGNDVYKVDNPNDLIIENPDEGIDRVDASISYDLSANVENLTLENIDNVTLLGNGNHDATGNELNNVLIGNTGSNLLDGRGGEDTMTGGLGNDSYIVEQAGDVVTELAGQGTDLLRTTLTSYTLGSDFENLTLEAGAVNGTGNELDNLIIGNDGNNALVGGDGDDTLDGGKGADTMEGGAGNDSYYVDNAGDLVTELLNDGQDAVFVDFSDGAAWNNNYNFTLPDHVEDAFFDFVSLNQITEIVGNVLDNRLQGNDGQNVLDGGGGNDTLEGGNGDDTYVVGENGDLVLENGGEGVDTVQTSIDYDLAADVENLQLMGTAVQGTGNNLNNQILGNAANNVLDDGGAGADTLSGGAGNDLYVVRSSIVVLDETGGSGHDTVQTYANLQLAGGLEDAILAGFDNLNVQGNSLGNLITSNTGNNLIDGGSGVDRVSYSAAIAAVNVNLGNAGGQGQGTGGGGADILIAVEGVLGSNYDDTLAAGTGDNILDGGLGSDSMTGGAGDDIYFVDDAQDVVVETSNDVPAGAVVAAGSIGGIIDTVIAAINFSLANVAFVENLTLALGAATTATGNTYDNVLIGNAGNNILNGDLGNDTLAGGSGNDTMAGGAGNDIYLVNVATDVVTEVASEGTDKVQSAASWTLGANVENLTLTGAGAINGTGNTLNNVITGNSGNNTLNGGTGTDTLNGMGGNDTLIWSSVDTYDGGAGTSDTLKVVSGNLNLTTIVNTRILNVETINLTGGGNNVLTLNTQDVLALSSTTNTLKVLGDAGDSIEIVPAFTDLGLEGAFHKYAFGGATLLVDIDLTNVA